MSNKERITIIIDDTGNIMSNVDTKAYGFGYVICPYIFLSEIEDLLHKNHLDQIHMKNLNITEKINISQSVSNFKLEKYRLFGGSVIRKDHFSFEDNVNKFLIKEINSSNSKILDEITSKESKDIISLSEFYKKENSAFYNNQKLYDFYNNSLRIPLINTVAFYRSKIIEIDLIYGSSGEPNSFLEKSNKVLGSDFKEKLNLFINDFCKNVMSYNTSVIINSVGVNPSNDLIFGLADLFASVGRYIFYEKRFAETIYGHLQNLFPKTINLPGKVREGIYIIK